MPTTAHPDDAVGHACPREPSPPIDSIDGALLNLAESLAQLSAYIAAYGPDLSAEEIARLHAVRGQNVSRLVRILREKRTFEGGFSGPLRDQIAEALHLAGIDLDVEL